MYEKIICLLLITILFSVTLFACSDSGELGTESGLESGTEPYPTFYFDSIEELFAFFQVDSETGEIPAVSQNKSYGNPEKVISEKYTDFVNEMIETPKTYVATQKGETIPFLNKEGAPISL